MVKEIDYEWIMLSKIYFLWMCVISIWKVVYLEQYLYDGFNKLFNNAPVVIIS